MVSKRLRVAYLVKTFPRLSETFILNEILGVEGLGLELEIFSLRRLPPESEPIHPIVHPASLASGSRLAAIFPVGASVCRTGAISRGRAVSLQLWQRSTAQGFPTSWLSRQGPS